MYQKNVCLSTSWLHLVMNGLDCDPMIPTYKLLFYKSACTGTMSSSTMSRFSHVVRKQWYYAAAVLRSGKLQMSRGIHTCTGGPLGCSQHTLIQMNASRYFLGVSSMRAWQFSDGSLCQHFFTSAHVMFKSHCAWERGRVWMWLTGLCVCMC